VQSVDDDSEVALAQFGAALGVAEPDAGEELKQILDVEVGDIGAQFASGTDALEQLDAEPGRRRTRLSQPNSARQPKHTRPTEDSMPELPWTQGACSLWADVADSKAATSRRWPRGDSRATTGVARIARSKRAGEPHPLATGEGKAGRGE
jgi:hypothetical protein